MCRWLAYSGAPIALEELLFKTEVSLIDQSLSARRSTTTTNGDGFGIGWYGAAESPGVYRDVRPAWNDENLRDLAAHVESPLFVAHARSATEGLVQRANCHPFRHGRWLLVHNGSIRDFRAVKRELMLSVDPVLFPEILGTTDSELMFYLALTFGLDDEPLGALQRMVGFVEKVGQENGVEHPVEMTLGLSDGARVIAVRYSSDGQSPSLFHSKSIRALKELAPGDPRLERLSQEAIAVVSEPLTELTDVWVEIPEASSLVVTGADVVSTPFRPAWH